MTERFFVRAEIDMNRINDIQTDDYLLFFEHKTEVWKFIP